MSREPGGVVTVPPGRGSRRLSSSMVRTVAVFSEGFCIVHAGADGAPGQFGSRRTLVAGLGHVGRVWEFSQSTSPLESSSDTARLDLGAQRSLPSGRTRVRENCVTCPLSRTTRFPSMSTVSNVPSSTDTSATTIPRRNRHPIAHTTHARAMPNETGGMSVRVDPI
jgi:hypothetical protein